MVFQFEHVGLDHGADTKFRPRALAPGELADSLSRWQDALADVGWNSLYFANHDQPRSVSRFGDDSPEHWRASATALATVLHLQRGTPYIYQGEELGMTNSPFAGIDDYRDVESVNWFTEAVAAGTAADEALRGLGAVGRDNARTPVQWDASTSAGFSTGEPWIAVNPNHATINAEAQYDDPDSVFSYHRALIALRHELPVVAHGTFTRVDAGDAAVFAFERELAGDYGDSRLLVIVNLSSESRSPAISPEILDRWVDARVLLQNVSGDPSPAAALAPWEARVLRA
jgi:oligo-1,6-glucosidase